MPPKTPVKNTPEKGSNSATVDLTPAETKLMALAFLCMKGPPSIDLAKFAQLGNYKNQPSASTAWSRIKRRMMEAGKQAFPDAALDSAVATPSTPGGTVEPKATPGTNETPTKRKRGGASARKGKGKAKAAEDAPEEPDAEDTPSKKQKRVYKKHAAGPTPKKEATKSQEEDAQPLIEEKDVAKPSIEKDDDNTASGDEANDKAGEKSAQKAGDKSVVEKA